MLIAALLFGLVAATLLVTPVISRSPFDRRARALVAALRPASVHGNGRNGFLKSFETKLTPERLRAAAAQLEGSGIPVNPGAIWLVVAELALPIAAPLLALPFFLGATPLRLVLMLGLAAIAGRYAPRLMIANARQRRHIALARALPDALDLLMICAESGLGFDVALARTARELAPAQPALAAELRQTALELGILPNRAEALHGFARRVPLPLVIALVNTLIQTERFGTPLVHSLRLLTEEARSARLLRAEAKAARLPAFMTVPMIGFVLPPLFIVLLGPAIIEAMGAK